MSAADRVAAVVSRWVATYTRHLPTEVGGRRRAEVASDLWEQRADGRAAATREVLVALSILRRMVAGMPADLRWRRGQLAAARGRMPQPEERRLLHALASNWWLVLAGLVGATEVVVGARIALRGAEPVTGTGITAKVGPSVGGGLMIAGAGLLLLSGIVWRRRSPSSGMILIVAGSLPALLLSPWILPLTVVLAVGLDLVRALGPGGRGTRARSAYQVALGLGIKAAAVTVFYLILVARVPWWAGLVLLGLLAAYGRLRRRDHAT
jgi:hypothetical protein